jgi:hypothetical protein
VNSELEKQTGKFPRAKRKTAQKILNISRKRVKTTITKKWTRMN